MNYIYSTLGYTGYDISTGCFFNTAVGPMETSNCVAISPCEKPLASPPSGRHFRWHKVPKVPLKMLRVPQPPSGETRFSLELKL